MRKPQSYSKFANPPFDTPFGIRVRHFLALAVLAHALMWSIGSALLVSNLHQDTLEIIYWSRDLSLGFRKHPPLLPYLVNLILVPGPFSILVIELFGQLAVVVSAFYIYRTVGLFASRCAQILAVCALLVSPAANVYGIQLNHNLLLLPTWSACLYYGLSYLEQQRRKDVLALALAAAIGVWTKYEIFFVLLGLVAVSALWKPYRPAWRRLDSYLCVGGFLLLIAPHVWWLIYRDPSAFFYATGDLLNEGVNLLKSANHLLAGVSNAVLGALVAFVIAYSSGYRFARLQLWCPAVVACVVPVVGVVVISLMTQQNIRQGWLLPFTPSFLVAIASVIEWRATSERAHMIRLVKVTLGLSACILLLSAGFLVLKARGKQPIAAYSFDSIDFTDQLLTIWNVEARGPLRCLIVNDHNTAVSPLLWLPQRPHVVDFSVGNWSSPEKIAACEGVGGLAIWEHTRPDLSLAEQFPRLCPSRATIQVAARFGTRSNWTYDVAILPPLGQSCPDAP